jgi:hypothetical protein
VVGTAASKFPGVVRWSGFSVVRIRHSGRPQRWSTVADLYNKIHTTQPAYDVGGLSTQAYVDMMAFLLKQNGFPSGAEELKDNLSQMRNMTWRTDSSAFSTGRT